MAVLTSTGTQLVLMFLCDRLFKKVLPEQLCMRWLSSQLKFNCLPTIEELKKIEISNKHHDSQSNSGKNNKKGHSKSKGSGSNTTTKQNVDNVDTIKIRTSDLTRLTLKKTDLDFKILSLLPRGEALQSLVDFAFMANSLFLLIQMITYLFPDAYEFNLGSLWMSLVFVQAFALLCQITAPYFYIHKSIGERSLCILSGFLLFIVALLILLANDAYLEFGLDNALSSVRESFARASNVTGNLPSLDTVASKAPEPRESPKSFSFIMIKFLFALTCSLVGMLFTFPGLRFGHLHEALTEQPQATAIHKLVFSLNYISNLLIICLWCKPFISYVLMYQTTFGINELNFDCFRSSTVVLVNLFKLCLAPKYIAAFLDSGSKCINQLKLQGSTVTGREVRFVLSSYNNYVNIVGIQYIVPALMCLHLAVMLPTSNSTENIFRKLSASPKILDSLATIIGDKSIIESIESIMARIDVFFSPSFRRGIFGFATWWTHFAWFFTSTAGIIYHKYFSHNRIH